MDLVRPLEVAICELKVLAHHAELDVLSAEDVPKLAQRFLGTNIGACVSRSVIPGKKQFEFLAWLPTLTFTKNPSRFGALDIRADPCLENVVHHAADPPTFAGQLWYGYVKFVSRLNFKSG